MISEDCGVHSGVGGRISYQSAEALIPTAELVWNRKIQFSAVYASVTIVGLNVSTFKR